MFNLRLAALLLFGAVAFSAHAQESDYIITNNGDTIKCKIRRILFSSSIRYKTDKMDEYKEESASTIKQYFRHKENYPMRSVILPAKTEPQFLGLEEEGKINIYEKIIQSDRYTTYLWYAQKGSDPVIDIKSNAILNHKSKQERKEDFINLISDNKEVLEYYKAAKSFSFDHIRNTVHYYNTGEAPKPKVTEPVEESSTESN